MKFNLPLPDITSLSAAAEEGGTPDTIGYVVLSIIVGPVILLALAAMFGKPRTFKIPALFLGSVVMFIGAMIAGFAAIGILLKFIVPQ